MMMLLLDSNVLWWWMAERSRLSDKVRTAIRSAGSDLFVSVASVWELEIKQAGGKLHLTEDFWPMLRRKGAVTLLDIGAEDAIAAARLPMHHRDPFDRLIIAQAVRRALTIATSDSAFAAYGVPVLRA